MKIFESHSPTETTQIAKFLAKTLNAGDIVAFYGDLGAGKTAFVKGIADFFHIDDEVSSPTFTLVNQYDGDYTLYHFDAYRLENISSGDLDWLDDYLFGDGICLIEWAENIATALPQGHIVVKIEKDLTKGESYRKFTILKQGE